MRYLQLSELLELHGRILANFGGTEGVLHFAALKSALAQPLMTFGGEDLYPSISDKAAALWHSLVSNHPFVDGNKRVGHAAMSIFLDLNGYAVEASVDEQETVVLRVATGEISRAALANWLESHIHPKR